MEMRILTETWQLATPFVTARGPRTEAEVVVVELSHNGQTGRGEGMPHFRFNESAAKCSAQLESIQNQITAATTGEDILTLLPAGSARNALDCAWWDLQAALTGKPVWQLAGLPEPRPLNSVQTLSLDTPSNMAAVARQHRDKKVLKLKVSGTEDLPCLTAVREAAPTCQLVADANEGWTPAIYRELIPTFEKLGVAMIEQPFPQADDAALAQLERPIPVYADESYDGTTDAALFKDRYDGVNIKLDKSGGLTMALQAARSAEAAGMGVMVGCMVSTSLAMAPAFAVAGLASYIDLDGMTWLKDDRQHPMTLSDNGEVSVPEHTLWRLV